MQRSSVWLFGLFVTRGLERAVGCGLGMGLAVALAVNWLCLSCCPRLLVLGKLNELMKKWIVRVSVEKVSIHWRNAIQYSKLVQV